MLGDAVGVELGLALGERDGRVDGLTLGLALGAPVGDTDGLVDGLPVGLVDGLLDGLSVGAQLFTLHASTSTTGFSLAQGPLWPRSRCRSPPAHGAEHSDHAPHASNTQPGGRHSASPGCSNSQRASPAVSSSWYS